MNYRLLFILLFNLLALTADSQVNIWQDEGRRKVELTPYPADQGMATGTAVIVCPGGSYFWHDMDAEGHEVGLWLQRHGISAFVLRYRTAYVPAFVTHYRLLFRGNRYPDPQDDLLQALRHVRANAGKYGVNPDSIGVMGFSAGGHLVMSSAELFPKEERPAFIVPVYPVVTMSDDAIVQSRSRRALLGRRWKDPALRDRLSMERHAGAGMPPVFLVCCTDDPVVDWRNSLVMEEALSAAGVPHECHVFEKGGHGFGISSGDAPWFPMFLEWFGRL